MRSWSKDHGPRIAIAVRGCPLCARTKVVEPGAAGIGSCHSSTGAGALERARRHAPGLAATAIFPKGFRDLGTAGLVPAPGPVRGMKRHSPQIWRATCSGVGPLASGLPWACHDGRHRRSRSVGRGAPVQLARSGRWLCHAAGPASELGCNQESRGQFRVPPIDVLLGIDDRGSSGLHCGFR